MARFVFTAFYLAILSSSVDAFTSSSSVINLNRQQIKLHLLAPEDVEVLMGKANGCANGECSLDEVADLIDTLKVQQKELSERVQQVKAMVQSLETVNSQDSREVDEVRETVRALFRIFQLGDKGSGNDYPGLTKAMGWTGEVGGGPTTAYDSLPPKPWKASPSK